MHFYIFLWYKANHNNMSAFDDNFAYALVSSSERTLKITGVNPSKYHAGNLSWGAIPEVPALYTGPTLAYNGYGAFENAFSVVEIASGAFSGRTEFAEGPLVLPKSLVIIGANAFNGVKITGRLTIPASVTSIGDNAFNGTLIDELVVENETTSDLLSGVVDATRVTSKEIAARIATDSTLNTLKVPKANPAFTGTTTIPTAVISAATVANATIHAAANIATNVTGSASIDYYEHNISEKNKNARFRVLTTAGNLLSAGGVGENVAPIEVVLTDGTYRTGAALVSELLARLNAKNVAWIGGSAIVWAGTAFDANTGAIKLGYITPAPGSVTDPAIVIRTKFVGGGGVSYNSSGVLGAVGASVGAVYEDGAFVLTYGNRAGINFPQAVNLGATPTLTVNGSAALDGSVAVSGEWGFNVNKPRYNAQALATQSYTQSKIQLVNGTSLLSTVKTLADIASAIGADPQFAVTVQTSQSAIIQSIASMASVRSTAVSSLSSSLSAQVSALQSVDLSLSSALSGTIPVRVSQVESVSTLLLSTVSGLQSTDVVTSTAMSEATSARSSQTQSLNSAISTAASLLQAADTVLSTSISAAVLTRSANVSANSVTWSTHVSSLETTDASLAAAVVSASGARSSAMASLSSIMVDAVPVLESADAAFTSALQSQTVQRVASVAALSGAISAQVSAAESINVAILPQITASASTAPHATTGTVFNLLSVNVNDSVAFVKSGGGVLAVGDKVVISYSPTDYLKGTVTAVSGSNVTMTVTFKTTTATETTIYTTTGSFGASVASSSGSHVVPLSAPAFVAGSNYVVTSMTGALFSSTNTGTYSVSLLDASNATIATAASEFFNASQTPKTHSFISAFLAKGATNLKQRFSHSAGLSTQIVVNFTDNGAYTVLKGYAVPYSSGAVTLEESNGGLQSARISAVAALSAGALSTANSLSAVIQTNQSELTANVSSRSADVASLASAASQSVSSLQSVTSQLGSALSVASSERSAGVSSLSSAVATGASTIASTAAHISGALSAQVSNRSAAVLAAVTSLVGAAPSTLDTLFEIATALDAGPALYSMISATSTSLASNGVARSTGVSSISASLSAVASTLHVADASLASGISAATADRIGRIASVSSGNSAFISSAQSRLDSVLVGVSTGVSARVSGVNSVSASLASVASALQTADSAVLSAGISAAVSARASGVASSSVALSSAVASLQTTHLALSSGLSAATSVRQSGTDSVSAALSGVVSSQHSSITALSTAYSALNAGINLYALADVAAVNSAIGQVVGVDTVSGLDTLAEIATALNNNASLATTLTNAINGRASLSAVASLSDAVLLKASQTDLSQLVSTVGTKATAAEVSQLQTAVSSMASTVNGSISSQVQSLQSNMTVSTNVFQLLSDTIRQVDTLYIHSGFVNADGSINYRVNKLANMVLQSSSLTFAVDANYAVTKVTQVIAVRFDPTQVSVKYSSRGVEYTLNPISLVSGVHTFSIDSSSTADYANNATAVVITANETAVRSVPDNSPFTVAKLALSAYTYATPTVQTPYDATTWSDATGKISQVLRINFEPGVRFLQIDGAVHVVWGTTQFVHTLEYLPGADPAGAVVVKALSSQEKLESAPLTLTNVYNDYPQHAVPSEVGGSKSVSRSGSTHTYAVSYSSATASAIEWQMYDVGTGTYSALSDSGIPFGTFMNYGFERIGQPLFRLRAKTGNGRRASAFVIVNAEAVVFSKPTLSSVAYNTLSAGSYRLNATYAVESQVSAVKVVNPYTGGTYIPSQAASGGSVTFSIDYTAAQVASNVISVAVIALANASGLESAASDAFIPIGQYAAPTVSNTAYSATRSAGSYTACSATLTCGVANGVTAVRVLKPNLSAFHSDATSLPNAFYLKTGGSNWRDLIPLLAANTTDNNLYWQPDQDFHNVNYNSENQVANQFSYFAAYWLNANRASNGQSFSVNTYATGTFWGTPNSQPFSGVFTFTATSDYPVTTYNGSLSGYGGTTYILTPQTDGINAGIVASGGVKVSNVAVANGSASPVVTFVNTVAPLDLVVVAQGNENGHESAASAQQALIAQFAAPTLSGSVTYSGNTANMTYAVAAGVTAVQVRKASDGSVITSGVTTSVNTGNQTASISVVVTENVSIVVVALGNANGRESAASATQALLVQLSTDVVQDANGTTIKYVGSAAAVPTATPLFVQANPRGTGVEWFAVVKQDMKTAISSYAGGTDGPFKPPGQSVAVEWKNIVTTLMTDMSGLFSNRSGFNSPIASWDTAAVTNMSYMFYNAAAFNQPIGAWNTGAVTNMQYMFLDAGAFNQPIGTWNTGAVTDMNYMFYNASAFNQNISGWNVANVTPKPPTEFRTASALTAPNTPVWFPIVQDANGTTIKYVGSAAAVPTSAPLFVQANPRGTGVEWFAVVKQDMNAAITNYASGTDGPFKPPGQSVAVPFNNIVTTLMTGMNDMFANKTSFNEPIASWDTSNVTTMYQMFANATAFNRPIGAWNTSNVTTMYGMFYSASAYAFNQPIGAWNTGAVTNMNYMFMGATAFNQNISTWNVGAVVTKPPTLFSDGSALTAQNTPVWFPIVLVGTTIKYVGSAAAVPTSAPLFIQANPRGTGVEWFAVVKQDMKAAISSYASGTDGPFKPPGQSAAVEWKNIVTTLMTDMSSLFSGNSGFNSPIASWDTGAVTDMSYMFSTAAAFNQPIGAWNTGAVTTMKMMFYAHTAATGSAFNQPIGTWNTTAVTNMSYMFTYTRDFNKPIGAWNTGAVTDMSVMFYGAAAFNQPIGTWNTTAVTNMNSMFYDATAFNQNISGWNITNVSPKPPTNFVNTANSVLTAQNNPFVSAFAAPTLSGSITYSGNTANMTYAVAAGVTAVQVQKASDGSVITSGVTTSVNTSNQTASISVVLTENVSIVVVALGNASGRESAASATQSLLVQYAAPTISGSITYSGNTANMTYTVAVGVTAVQVRKASDGSVIASGVTTSVNTGNQTASVSIAVTENVSIVVVALANSAGRESEASATQNLVLQTIEAPVLSGSITYSGNTANMTYTVAPQVTAVQVRKASDGTVISSGVTTSVNTSNQTASVSIALTETISIVVVALNSSGLASAASATQTLIAQYAAPTLSGSITYSGNTASMTYAVQSGVTRVSALKASDTTYSLYPSSAMGQTLANFPTLGAMKTWTFTISGSTGGASLIRASDTTKKPLYIDFRSDRVLLTQFSTGWGPDQSIMSGFHDLPRPTTFTVSFDANNYIIRYGAGQVAVYPNHQGITSIDDILDAPELYNSVSYAGPVINRFDRWEMSIAFRSTGKNNAWRGLIGDMRNGVNGRGWGVWVSSTNNIHFSWNNPYWDASPALTVAQNTDYVLAITKTSTSLRMDLTDVVAGTTQTATNASTAGYIMSANGPVTLGGWPNDTSENFVGTISHVSVVPALASATASGGSATIAVPITGSLDVKVVALANASGRESAASATQTLSLPLSTDVVQDANGTTIKYVGSAAAVPTSAPLFVLANPRGTGPELFAVVKQGMAAAISSYASGTDGPFKPPGQSVAVPFNNIVTTLMTDMSNLFRGKSGFNQPIGAWDTSAVTNMSEMFAFTFAFNQPIGAWNTAAVTNMREMFSRSVINQPIGAWNTSAVTDMSFMFIENIYFNQPIDTWNTAAVTNMSGTFALATAFNKPIGSWNTAAVTSMERMFKDAIAFNQPIDTWNTGAVTNMNMMFYHTTEYNATAFNQNISGWNVSSVVTKPPTDFVNPNNTALTAQNTPNWFSSIALVGTTIKYVGSAAAVPTSAPLFVQANPRGYQEWFAVVKQGMKAAISSYADGTSGPFIPPGQSVAVEWKNIVTTLMTEMSGLFISKSGFNGEIASWDTGAVTNMAQMFYGASAFNQAIGSWNTGAVTTMDNMFVNATNFNKEIGTWNTSAVTNMSYMFYNATAFNQAIDTWNTGAVANMNYMFYNAIAFNQNISGWNVDAVTSKPPSNFSNGSALTALNTPLWFPVVQDANGTTIKYMGNAVNVPTLEPRFIQANPRGTGVEWFAVVKQGMKAAISNYAGGTSGPFIPPGQSVAVPFNNIVTTLMTDMSSLFISKSGFNQPIGAWDTGAVTNMDHMFWNATAFNQPIGAWNTAAVTNMYATFGSATAFNQPIGSWNTAAVTNMMYMFSSTTAFNQSIGTWNTSAVTNMDSMFWNATAFNQNINGWNITNVSPKPPNYFISATSALTPENNPFGWSFTYYSGVYAGTSIPTQQLLSDSNDSEWNNSGWGSQSVTNPYIQADFRSAKTITSITIGPFSSWNWTYLNGAALQYSNDGTNWSNVISSIQANTSLPTATYSTSISARYVRIIYLYTFDYYLGISTFKFTFA